MEVMLFQRAWKSKKHLFFNRKPLYLYC